MISPAAPEAEPNPGAVPSDHDRPERRSDPAWTDQGGDCPRCDELRAEVDELSARILGLVDETRGAEAQRAAAEGRVNDLEMVLYMQDLELQDLRGRLADSSCRSRGFAYRVARRLYRSARGLAGGPTS